MLKELQPLFRRRRFEQVSDILPIVHEGAGVVADPLDRTLDAHGAAQGLPVEHQRGAGIGLELRPLAAFAVGVEHEAALIGVLQ